MKILFISPSFFPATYYGGPIFINRSYCQALAATSDVELEVLTTDSDGPRKRISSGSAGTDTSSGYAITYCRRWFRPDIAPGLLLRLPATIYSADVVHLTGVYSFTTLPTLLLCRLLRKPVVWSALGALQRWDGTTRQRVKRLWEELCNVICRPDRVLLHVTSKEEQSESMQKIRNVTPLVLRNGIDIPEALTKDFPPGGSLRLLYIGRLHPIKGIENLLYALTKVKCEFTLAICGEGAPSYEASLRSLVKRLDLDQRVRFHGQVNGEAKEQQFREAALCVAPSFKEAFCTVVLESLARGLPVIAGHGTPWQRVEEMGCGIWCSNNPEDLSDAIDRAAQMPLARMGERGRAWMQREFSWDQVATETIETYRSLIDGRQYEHSETSTCPKAV